MNEQLEVLTLKLEDQIETMLDTIVSIQDLEAKEGPTRHLKEWSQTALGMCFYSVLMRHLWDKMGKYNLDKDQRIELITEIGNATHEHYKELYGYDSKKDIT